MSQLKSLLNVLTASALLLAIAGCSGDDTDGRGQDPAGDAGPMPTEPVAAEDEVTTRLPATVMDTGTPELCLGAVAESYPPQCGGPTIEGWDWAAHDGHYDQQGDVRWGMFHVTGTWDGATFTVASAQAVASVNPTASELPAPVEPPLPADELGRIADEVGDLGGAMGAYTDDVRVVVDVIYDDGSLQQWADHEYGAGVVVVTPALIAA